MMVRMTGRKDPEEITKSDGAMTIHICLTHMTVL